MDAPEGRPTWTRRIPALLWCGGMAPFLLSLGFHATGAVPQRIAPPPSRGSLAFDQYAVNLGAIAPTPYAYVRFSFTNVGDETVHIRELKTSCGCLQPRLAQREYQPGESGHFDLRIQTANEPAGPKDEFVRVLYDDPQPRETELTFKVVLPENQVTVRPGVLIVYQFGLQPMVQKIVVTDQRKDGLTITGVDSDIELLTAELEGVEEGADGTRRMTVAVIVPIDVPPNLVQGSVILTTDDPKYSRLVVPVRVQGRPTPLAYPGPILRRN